MTSVSYQKWCDSKVWDKSEIMKKKRREKKRGGERGSQAELSGSPHHTPSLVTSNEAYCNDKSSSCQIQNFQIAHAKNN